MELQTSWMGGPAIMRGIREPGLRCNRKFGIVYVLGLPILKDAATSLRKRETPLPSFKPVTFRLERLRLYFLFFPIDRTKGGLPPRVSIRALAISAFCAPNRPSSFPPDFSSKFSPVRTSSPGTFLFRSLFHGFHPRCLPPYINNDHPTIPPETIQGSISPTI